MCVGGWDKGCLRYGDNLFSYIIIRDQPSPDASQHKLCIGYWKSSAVEVTDKN